MRPERIMNESYVRAELGRQSVLARLGEQIGVDPDRRAELIYAGGRARPSGWRWTHSSATGGRHEENKNEGRSV